MSLEDRLFLARRARCAERLIRIGQSPEVAERWCDAWEREAELRGRAHTSEYWEHGQLWIDAQIATRRTPEALLARR